MSESINIPHRQRSSSESTTSSLNHKPSSVKAALPSTSPFSSQPFKETSVSPTQPQTLSIQPPRRPSGSFELSGQPSPPGASGNSGITSLFRRFSFKGTNQPPSSQPNETPGGLNTIPAKQPLMSVEQPEQPATSVSPKLAPGRRKSDQKRSVSPMVASSGIHEQQEEFYDEADDIHLKTTSEKPLDGFVFCSTGILNRHELYKKAMEMAIEFGSPKYNCAIQLGAAVLLPAFIEQSYLEWIDGENVDVEALIQKYTLKPFANLIISMSGVEAGPIRKEIERSLIANGANISRDLHKQCTHLVTENTTSQKVKWARNYNMNNENKIKIVWTEWINACLAVNGRLPEEEFSTEKERPDISKYKPSQVKRPGILPQETEVQQPVINKKRSFVEQPGNEDLEKAVLKKHKVAKSSLVEGILSQTTKSPIRERSTHIDTSNSFFKDDSFNNASNAINMLTQPILPATNSFANNNIQPASSADQGKVFNNYTFSHRGFEKSKSHRLDLELEKYGASVTNSVNLADVTIVPFNRPFEMPTISPEFAASLCITFSGLDECDRTQIMRFFRLLGITTKSSYPRGITHLISVMPPRGKRLERALEWQTPVVDVQWVWQTISTGRISPIEQYIWTPEKDKQNETNFFDSQSETTVQPPSIMLPSSQSSPKRSSQLQSSPTANIPLRKTLSTNPFKIKKENSSNGELLHDSIVQLLKQEGEKIYPNNSKTKKRPRLKRTSTSDSANNSVTPAPIPLEEQVDNRKEVTAAPSKATSSPLSSPSPPPSILSQVNSTQTNGQQNESLRIMYDDPEARNERKRILQALTNSSSDTRNAMKSDENYESSDIMYRFAKEDFEKPIAENRPKRNAAKESNEKTNNQQQYDPTQLDEF
ncbi:hypothetical protein E3Q18_02202 [Wallemia mellicola]|uniref:BRCT domain-containing protein n=1 Tax=Wallemia mellicola TaxID=1708541 RepID=A0A4T0PNR9_9BASI|nr:hypothetical protein E3Q19_02056 [Wallemia mellicola]TIB98130.1 hypothetical protein E3Q18_02202 [Wallemia mellicola]TIC11316.1 hypothetical protein E3Q14_02359 [Wallemia mellicola]TIC12650.1 hypothetical protein E3Q15_02241 [Wallemia mellicola]TIC30432.1 hypothetical protein E3Q10_02140 [Wallemia mellicola]